VVERDGTLIMVDDERMPLQPGEVPMMKKVRFRTLGCYPLTGAVESEADTLKIIQEMLLTTTSERQGRVIDHDSLGLDGKEEAGGLFLMAGMHVSDLATEALTDIAAYLQQHEHKSLLRFITCGSVDDGKSTLIGRLLYESKMLFDDQLAALEADSRSSAPRAARSTSRCWSTAWPPSASRASPSTSPTASSAPTSASSSSPTRRATSSTRATWSPARPPPTSR
jgi:hypothetical protein